MCWVAGGGSVASYSMRVHFVRQVDITVRVETIQELVGLIVKIVLRRKFVRWRRLLLHKRTFVRGL